MKVRSPDYPEMLVLIMPLANSIPQDNTTLTFVSLENSLSNSSNAATAIIKSSGTDKIALASSSHMKTPPKLNKSKGNVLSISVLLHLLKRGGWDRWSNVVREMRLPSTSFASLEQLLRRRSGSSSVDTCTSFMLCTRLETMESPRATASLSS